MTVYQIVPMTQSQAETIADTWKYDGAYSFYDMDQDEEDMAEFLNPAAREGKIFAVIQKEKLVGFLSVTYEKAETEIGFGIRPDLTGQGLGQSFVSFLVETVQQMHQHETISLRVAAFNQRAITVYERVGFQQMEQFDQITNGDVYPFIRMVLKCNI